MHVQAALDNGVSYPDLLALVGFAAPYAGYPAAADAIARLAAAVHEFGADTSPPAAVDAATDMRWARAARSVNGGARSGVPASWPTRMSLVLLPPSGQAPFGCSHDRRAHRGGIDARRATVVRTVIARPAHRVCRDHHGRILVGIRGGCLGARRD